MSMNEIYVPIIVSILSGLISYILSINKSKKDITQLREQSKLDIEKIINQHKLDLEALERKHQMEIEKIEIEHKNKIELMHKEMGNKLGEEIISKMMTAYMNSPEAKRQMNESILQGVSKNKRKR